MGFAEQYIDKIQIQKMKTCKYYNPYDYQYCFKDGNLVQVLLGSYGCAYLAKHRTANQFVAIKKINAKIAVQLLQLFSSLDHKNIIKLYSYFVDEANSSTYLILEYPQNDKLMTYVKKNNIKNRATLYEIVNSLCSAVEYLQLKKIFLPQIQPENILINKCGDIKICGFPIELAQEKHQALNRVEYCAPEILVKGQAEQRSIIWSIGVILYQLIQGHPPFRGQQPKQILDQIKKQIAFSQKFRNEQVQFIKLLLNQNSKNRLNFKQMINVIAYSLNQKQMGQNSKRTTADSDTLDEQLQKINLNSDFKIKMSVMEDSLIKQCKEIKVKQQKIKINQGKIRLTDKKNKTGYQLQKSEQSRIKVVEIKQPMNPESKGIKLMGVKQIEGTPHNQKTVRNNSSNIQPISTKNLGNQTESVSIFEKLRQQKRAYRQKQKDKLSLKPYYKNREKNQLTHSYNIE